MPTEDEPEDLSASGKRFARPTDPTEELAAIFERARQVGVDPRRVATALGLEPEVVERLKSEDS